MAAPRSENVIAIVGGGFSGGAVAYHLASRAPQDRILVFEPRSILGAGLAYDTPEASNRINVPAAKMSLLPGDDGHFVRWLARTGAAADDAKALGPDGNLYPRRSVFGAYVAEHIAPFIGSKTIHHVRATVTRVSRNGSGWNIATADGQSHHARIVVLATTHPPPAVPPILERAFAADPRLVRDSTAENALQGIARDARVLVVGTGLTMADVAAALDARGHTGPITALSRHGLLSRGHPPQPQPLSGTFARTFRSASELLHAIRTAIDVAAESGNSWHGVLDQVRAEAQAFWPRLAIGEQQRIVRHLRAYWDVHRFRVAPQVAAVVQRRIAEGSLEVIAASIRSARLAAGDLEVGFTRRHARDVELRPFDAVVVTTGPAHGAALATEPHLASLAEAGWITADPVGLGIATSRQGRAIERGGFASPDLFVAGPLARGTFGELMGLPQVSEYALFVARQVLEALAARRPAPLGACQG